MAALTTRTLTPTNGLEDALGAIADLRITVFRDWPYLYDGSLENERAYLAHFAESPGAVCIAAYDGDKIVGAATGLPLDQAHGEFRAPLVDAGMEITRIFYCAESVLLPAYRGRGLYRTFFDGREDHARRLGGYTHAIFCGVQRPDDHPRKPMDYQPLDTVWQHFGYRPRGDLICHFSWLDVGEDTETEKPMMFWEKRL